MTQTSVTSSLPVLKIILFTVRLSSLIETSKSIVSKSTRTGFSKNVSFHEKIYPYMERHCVKNKTSDIHRRHKAVCGNSPGEEVAANSFISLTVNSWNSWNGFLPAFFRWHAKSSGCWRLEKPVQRAVKIPFHLSKTRIILHLAHLQKVN